MNKISIQTIYNAHVLVHISHTFCTTEEKKNSVRKSFVHTNNEVLDFMKNFFFLNHRNFSEDFKQKEKKEKNSHSPSFFPLR